MRFTVPKEQKISKWDSLPLYNHKFNVITKWEAFQREIAQKRFSQFTKSKNLSDKKHKKLEKIANIVELRSSGLKMKMIANKFGVSTTRICQIIKANDFNNEMMVNPLRNSLSVSKPLKICQSDKDGAY